MVLKIDSVIKVSHGLPVDIRQFILLPGTNEKTDTEYNSVQVS